MPSISEEYAAKMKIVICRCMKLRTAIIHPHGNQMSQMFSKHLVSMSNSAPLQIISYFFLFLLKPYITCSSRLLFVVLFVHMIFITNRKNEPKLFPSNVMTCEYGWGMLIGTFMLVLLSKSSRRRRNGGNILGCQ